MFVVVVATAAHHVARTIVVKCCQVLGAMQRRGDSLALLASSSASAQVVVVGREAVVPHAEAKMWERSAAQWPAWLYDVAGSPRWLGRFVRAGRLLDHERRWMSEAEGKAIGGSSGIRSRGR